MFRTNVGTADRLVRIVLGLGLLAAFFLTNNSGPWHWAYLIGIVPLATGLFSTCPVYSVFGISTCPTNRA